MWTRAVLIFLPVLSLTAIGWLIVFLSIFPLLAGEHDILVAMLKWGFGLGLGPIGVTRYILWSIDKWREGRVWKYVIIPQTLGLILLVTAEVASWYHASVIARPALVNGLALAICPMVIKVLCGNIAETVKDIRRLWRQLFGRSPS